MSPARIFICTDTGQAAVLDRAAAELTAGGHSVVRGSSDTPGQRKRYSQAERTALIDDADVAVFTIRHECSRELLAGARRLRGVCYPVIGVESLDLEAAADLGVIVGHGAVRGNVVGMAEATIMLMLMLFYDVRTNIARMDAGLWRRPGHHARQLEGKIVGLIGFGRIAREVASRLAPFGVRILTYSPRTPPESLPAHVGRVDLETLLSTSDLVSVLAGLSPETHHLLDAARLRLLRPSAYLVNTGRGAIIDEAALAVALREGRIAGASLDTFADEPLASDSPLRGLGNVILTPHCVGHTVEGEAEFAPAMLENIERILRGELPLYCKNPDVEPAWRMRLSRLGAETHAANPQQETA